MVLLAGAGLMIQSVFRLLRTNLGFDPTNLINMEIQPRYDSETYRTTEANNFLLEEVHRRLSALPGVEAVGIVQKGYGQGKYAVTRQGNPVELNWNVSEVGTADAFKALRVRLLGGRLFEQADLGLGTNATAILVNQSLARRCWPGENAVGKILHSTNAYEPSTLEVVGVVADTRRMGYGFLIQPIVPMFYRPRQAVVDLGGYAGYDVLVRTRTKPEGLIQPLLAELKAAGPGLRKPTVALVKNDFYASTRAHRTYMWQLAAFGAVGLLLAAVGVYAILAHSVALREREMGIRMALGAGRPGVLRMVLRQGMTLVGIGIILGLGAAIALTRLLRSMLYGVSPLDPLTLAAGALLISLIALLACYVPARRAAKVDPMVALRCE